MLTVSGTSERAGRYQGQYGTQHNHCGWHDAQNDQGHEIRGSAPFAPLQLSNNCFPPDVFSPFPPGAPVPAGRTLCFLRAHPYPPGASEVTGAVGVKGCAPSPLKPPHSSGPTLPRPCQRTRSRRTHPMLPAGAPVPAARTPSRRAHPMLPPGAPVPAGRTRGYGRGRRKRVRTKPVQTPALNRTDLAQAMPAHPFSPGAPHVPCGRTRTRRAHQRLRARSA